MLHTSYIGIMQKIANGGELIESWNGIKAELLIKRKRKKIEKHITLLEIHTILRVNMLKVKSL